jgi:succinate dehydrogenase / fumarate reductase cytochrome b subunit
VRKERPKNLQISTVNFPITAIASILHRISGIIVFIVLALFLILLNYSLTSEQEFQNIARYFDSLLFDFVIWGGLTALAYHAVFGVRHMIQDLGHWEELESAVLSTKLAFLLTALLSISVGWLLW